MSPGTMAIKTGIRLLLIISVVISGLEGCSTTYNVSHGNIFTCQDLCTMNLNTTADAGFGRER